VHRRPHLTPAAGALLLLAACSSAPGQAPRAADPACTKALRVAPATVLGLGRVPLGVTGAIAWGDPHIVLRCGLQPLGPTTARCLNVNDQDWVLADPDADPVVFTSFGTDPAVDVAVPRSYQQPTGALVDLAPVAAALPRNGRSCS
jgi:Protein of unknown function (DUF3515)